MEKIAYPLIEKVYLVGKHQYCYRSGEPAEIKGLVMGTPEEKDKPRLAYKVEYYDGVIDYVVLSDVSLHYEIVTFKDIVKKKYS